MADPYIQPQGYSSSYATSCVFIKGVFLPMQPRVDVWQRFEYPGYGAQAGGLGDSHFEYTCVDYAESATLIDWASWIVSYKSYLCEIQSDIILAYNMLITDVSAPIFTAGLPYPRCEVTIRGVQVWPDYT